MWDKLKNIIKGARYKMFPVTTIGAAIGAQPAISQAMTDAVNTWMNMLHDKSGVNLPASIAGELARLTTVESEIDVSGSARADYLAEQFEAVRANLRSQLEFGIAGGSLVFKPYINGDKIYVNYIKANSCYPIAFDGSGHLSAIVFLDEIHRDKLIYRRLEYHRMTDEGCTVENKAFVTDNLRNNVLGEPVPLKSVPEWSELQPIAIIQNVDRLLFGYFKMPLANVIEPDSPLGVSGYSRAVETVKQANEQWERICWEFKGTELAIHADETLFRRGENNRPTLPEGHERLYRTVAGEIGDRNKLQTFSPEIRDTPLFNGFNNILKRIEFQCALAYGTLSDPQNVDKTAEEIKASKQRSFSTVRDIQTALQNALDDLIYSMDVWATVGGLAPAGRYKTSYDWDDSIISDPSERKKMFWGYVTAGKYPMWRYLVEFEGYSEDEAKAIQSEMSQDLGDPYAAS